MPEQYDTIQQRKAGNEGGSALGIDLLAGWPGLSGRGDPPPPRRNDSTPAPRLLPSQPAAGSDNGSGRRPAQPSPNALDLNRVNLLAGWRGLDTPALPVQGDRSAAPSDAAVKYPVKNGVLEINFSDLAKLKDLPPADSVYTTLKINKVPANAQVLHWADKDGYYFFFDGAGADNVYHYPRALKIIDMDGKRFDVDRSRLKVNEYALSKAAGESDQTKNPFATVTNPKVDALTYFKNMSKVSGESLAWEEQILRKGVEDTKNPYFQIYLADVLTMQALQPLVRGVLNGGQVTAEQRQQMIDKLTEAERQLKNAADLSYGPLYQMNRFPLANVVMPLAPEAFFYTPGPGQIYNPDYAYWGGSWDQAQRRRVALQFIKGLVQSNAFKYFELP